MQANTKTAIILGATGLTGSMLLQKLLNDDRYHSIKVFSRRSLEISHPKLEEIVCDLLDLKSQKEHFVANEVYCCIGTTTKKTPDKALYRKIDFGIPVQAAELCKINNIPSLLIVSAIGADANSSIFYNRTKGEMEAAVLESGIPKTHILQPSVISGDRGEFRLGEKFGIIVMTIFSPVLIGPIKKYRPIKAATIAEAMRVLANGDYKEQIITSDSIQELGG